MAKKTLPGHHDKDKRDYRGEYDRYHGKPEQRKRRAARNRARREGEKDGRVSKGDGKHIHHKDGNPKNNGKGNLTVMVAEDNQALSAKENLKKKKNSALENSIRGRRRT